ncbi:MAG: hypothetical protein JWM76_681 [Pseudonocardiales bacterium]|nr:hypothetical protein [Pseudonocardiales bacterium]
MSIDPSVPVGIALQLGSHAVATDLHVEEPPGDARDRMNRAVEALTEQLRVNASDFFVSGSAPDLSSLLDGAAEDDRRAFLIELVLADPFAPYWFEMNKRRDVSRVHSLRRVATRSLALDIDSVDHINSKWNQIAKGEVGLPWNKIVVAGVGGLAVAGLAIAAGPVIAAAMPAAAGLNGAAAVSAGLAQLGFGSIASGGLGMTGGLWMLGLAGGALGAGGTAASQAAVQQLVSVPGSAHLLQTELRKLVLSASLAREQRWFEASIEQFDAGVDQLATAIDAELELERQRNDRKAQRVLELEKLAKTAIYAGSEIQKLLT